MVNQYETVFILTPVLSEAQIKETVEKFEQIITDNGGVIVQKKHWGLKKLAYPIQKKNSGYYHLVEFKAEGTLIDVLETQFRRDERVIRFLSTKMDKFAVQYADKVRAKTQLTEKS